MKTLTKMPAQGRPSPGVCAFACSLLAVTFLSQPAQADHAAAYANVLSGNTSYFAGDYVSAENLYRAAITNDPAWALSYNNRGLARFHRGDLTGAVLDFDTAKSYDTNYISPYLNKGKALAAQQLFSEAVSELRAGLALSTNKAPFYFNLGWVLDEQKLYSQAITNYSAAIALNTNEIRARLGRGVSYAKQGSATNAVADFYAVINGAASGDMLTAIAAYNLQLLRGPGVSFVSSGAVSNYVAGLFAFAAEQYDSAVASFCLAQVSDPNVPDIPWMVNWSYLKNRQQSFGSSWLQKAYALMESVLVRTLRSGEDVFVDGVKRGSAPSTLHLFPSAYDLSIRSSSGTKMQWMGPLYTDGTEGGSALMLLNPVAVSDFSVFGPVADTDRDWLADTWEMSWFNSLAKGPQDDETDHDGLPNLYESWLSANPTLADSDADGASDWQEYLAGTDPIGSASVLRLYSKLSGANVQLSFLSAIDKHYLVQYCSNVAFPDWQPVSGGSLVGNGSTLTVTVNASTVSRGFYRLELLP